MICLMDHQLKTETANASREHTATKTTDDVAGLVHRP